MKDAQAEPTSKPGKSFADELTVTLELPIEHGGETWTRLTMRRGRAGDQVDASQKGTVQEELESHLFAALCGVPQALIADLAISDIAQLQEAFLDLVGDIPEAPTPPWQGGKKSFEDKVTLPLRMPVTVDGLTYTSITLRRARARDQLTSAKAGMSADAKRLALLANLADLPPQVVRALDLADYRTLRQAYDDFLS